ncbi:MAG: IS21 family transposase [Bacteroidales bacterium]
MAGKPKRMSQIKQLLQLHEQGQSIKFIARSLGISKNTVKNYLSKVASLPLAVKALLNLDDPILEGMFHAGNPAYKDERYEHFKSKLDYFTQELRKRGVTRHLLWEEYLEVYPGGYGHTQFNFHLSQNLIARKPSGVLQHKPGEKLYIDFAGDPLSYVDPDTGEVIQCQVFVACLPYSDYSFAIAVRSQSVEDFLYALGCCLQELGGVPEVLVPDNMKSAIIKASPYEPDINRALDDFANHYNTTVIPARAYKPKDKALVENEVGIIYTRVYAKLRNQQFFGLAPLNVGIKGKIKDHNQTRMQLKPYSREEKFLAEEKHLLQPLPEQPFQLKYYRELTVAKNNHILLYPDKHYYSVPYVHIGSKVKVIYTRTMVHIYAKGQQVAVHVRDYKQGEYSSVKEHLCSAHQHYNDRSPSYYLDKAKSKSAAFYQLVELLFKQNRHPEQLYRTCDGLMSLQRKTEADVFSKACMMAIDYQNYSYRFVSNILKNKMTDEPAAAPAKPLPVHKNIRGRDYYKQSTIDF